MMTYTIDKLSENLLQMQKIAKLHYAESCPYDDIPLNVNWETLLKLEELGILKFFTMRKEGHFLGYAMVSVSFPIEYSESLQASYMNIFVHPEHRGNGGKFITWCDDRLRGMGVQVVNHHCKARNDYGKLLNRIGYVKMNVEYSKRLDK